MISIGNVINISVSAPPAGIAPYSVNNLACFTKDTPVGDPAEFEIFTNPTDVGLMWGTTSNVYKAAVAAFSPSPNLLTGGGRFIVVPMLPVAGEVPAETLEDSIARVKDKVYFGAVGYTHAAGDDEVLDAATLCQSLRKFLFVASSDATDLDGPDGLLFKLKDQTLSYARGLFHTDAAYLAAYKWGYAGRALSTNFSGSNTTQTMHLKQIPGVPADEGITATLLQKAKDVGADVYPNIGGRASLQSFGANEFWDDMYNLTWFVGALEIAGFNFLAQTSTKIPQTESGMISLKGAYGSVCEQALANRFVGPGKWTSGDRFGDPENFDRNIAERGYYVYSMPVAAQLDADRQARRAPVVQIAAKYQGAIHSSDVIIFVNK